MPRQRFSVGLVVRNTSRERDSSGGEQLGVQSAVPSAPCGDVPCFVVLRKVSGGSSMVCEVWVPACSLPPLPAGQAVPKRVLV